jgi:hypothetical protein
VLELESRALMQDFFRERRSQDALGEEKPSGFSS